MTCPLPELSALPRPIDRGRADNYPGDVRVRGNANAEEVAAVLAIVASRAAGEPDAYTRWRRDRLAALRRDAKH